VKASSKCPADGLIIRTAVKPYGPPFSYVLGQARGAAYADRSRIIIIYSRSIAYHLTSAYPKAKQGAKFSNEVPLAWNRNSLENVTRGLQLLFTNLEQAENLRVFQRLCLAKRCARKLILQGVTPGPSVFTPPFRLHKVENQISSKSV
jgi:hypothetical protein